MFITLEGIEGSGKSTLAKNLAKKILENGRDLILTREPGDSPVGKTIRQILMNPENQLSHLTEVFLFLADRSEHVETVIKPALAQNKIVLCDRYTDSTLAYQGYARGLKLDDLDFLNKLACQNTYPDLTLILDLPVQVGLKRANLRNNLESLESEARFEQESLDFHEKIRQGFLDLANKQPQRFFVINANQNPEEILSQAFGLIKAYI